MHSPVLTLARVDRLDLLTTFNVPIKIVDQVHYEITKPQNDPDGRVAAFLRRHGNSIEIIETVVGLGFKTLRARDPNASGSNLGEEAVSEYARRLAKTSGPHFVPLVLFEDPDVLTLPVATLANVHLLNTTGWLEVMHKEGLVTDAADVIDLINANRRTSMRPFDQPARTKKCARLTFERANAMQASPNRIDNDLSGLTLADVLERLEAGKCGHSAVMEWLRIDSYHELVATMHFNGRTMPGHRSMIITPETRELFRQLPRRTP